MISYLQQHLVQCVLLGVGVEFDACDCGLGSFEDDVVHFLHIDL